MPLKMRSYWLILPLALLCTAQLWGDSVTLKTGETVTGAIKSETDTEVTIEVPVSASITDERVLEKTDIAKIDKEQPDQIAYEQLIKVQPNPQSSYSSDSYDQILTSLNAFETTYPNSTYLPDIKKLAAVFQEEKTHVDAGEFKYLGKWISHDEAVKRSLQIEALQLYTNMQQQAASGDFVGAMQTFANIEQSYATTRSYPNAAALAQQVLVPLQQVLATDLLAEKRDQIQLKKTVIATAEPQKSVIIAQEKMEENRAAAVVAAAVKSGAKWVPLIPNSLVSIQTLQTVAATEAQRLATLPVAAMNQSIARVDAARTAMDQHDYQTANSLLVQATSLWAQNEDARYTLERLKEIVGTPTPSPKPKSLATPKPLAIVRPTPQMVNIITETPTPAPEKPYYMTISGSITIAAVMLVVGGIIAVIGQRRARNRNENAE
jgi:hypothetical protein